MTYTASTIFSGLGGGALGLQRAGFRLVGAIDSDAAAAADYRLLTGHDCTVADLATMGVDEFRAAHQARPDLLFTSPPCKSFSGCLPAALADTERYIDMSDLARRGIWLALEAWQDDPVPLIIMENVPRIMSRGRAWLDATVALLRAYGYYVRETTHDCGELGGLAQHRRRFLLVARHGEVCPEWLRVPPVQRVRGIGEVLSSLPLPLPGGDAGGPMHRLPLLSPLNLVRLALTPKGKDWRAIPDEVVLVEEALDPRLPTRSARQNGQFGVNAWDDAAHTVVGQSTVQNTWASVADPRLECAPRSTAYGVGAWEEGAGCVVGAAKHDNGAWSVADPRIDRPRREGSLGVKSWEEPSSPVIGAIIPQNHPCTVADPRLEHAPRKGGHGVGAWGTPSHAVIGEARIDKGASVADPRLSAQSHRHSGKYGVEDWNGPAHTVISESRTGKSWSAASDPRPALYTHRVIQLKDGRLAIIGPRLDLAGRRSRAIILALDGTWHRPLTTLELAALQGFPIEVEGSPLLLNGKSHAGWRQRIGNAVPPPAAEAIGREALATLAASRAGHLLLSSSPIWVGPWSLEALAS